MWVFLKANVHMHRTSGFMPVMLLIHQKNIWLGCLSRDLFGTTDTVINQANFYPFGAPKLRIPMLKNGCSALTDDLCFCLAQSFHHWMVMYFPQLLAGRTNFNPSLVIAYGGQCKSGGLLLDRSSFCSWVTAVSWWSSFRFLPHCGHFSQIDVLCNVLKIPASTSSVEYIMLL